MGLEIPGPLQWVASVAVGSDWPEADETALWRLRDAWQAAADGLEDVADEGDAAATAVLGTIQGDVSVAFEQYWTAYTTGEGSYLPDVQQLCTDLAAACDSMALSTEYTKYSIIAALVILAAQIVALLASAVATLGTSTAGIPIAEAATQLAVRAILVELLQEVVLQVAVNVGVNLAVDVAIQGGQHLHSGDQDWDWTKTGNAALSGVVAGLAGGVVGKGGQLAGSASRTFGQAAARGVAEGAVAGVVGNSLNSFLHGDLPSLQDLYSGVVGGGIGGASDGMGTRHEGLAATIGGPGHPTFTAGANSSGWPTVTPGGSTTSSNPPPVFAGSFNSGTTALHEPPPISPPNLAGVEGVDGPDGSTPGPPPTLDLPDPQR